MEREAHGQAQACRDVQGCHAENPRQEAKDQSTGLGTEAVTVTARNSSGSDQGPDRRMVWGVQTQGSRTGVGCSG